MQIQGILPAISSRNQQQQRIAQTEQVYILPAVYQQEIQPSTQIQPRYANQIQPSNDQNMQELLNMLLSSEALSGNSQQQTQRIDKNTMQLRQKLYDLLFSDEDIVRSAQTDSLQTFPFFQPFPPFPLPRLP